MNKKKQEGPAISPFLANFYALWLEQQITATSSVQLPQIVSYASSGISPCADTARIGRALDIRISTLVLGIIEIIPVHGGLSAFRGIRGKSRTNCNKGDNRR